MNADNWPIVRPIRITHNASFSTTASGLVGGWKTHQTSPHARGLPHQEAAEIVEVLFSFDPPMRWVV